MLKSDKVLFSTTIKAYMSAYPQFNEDVQQALEQHHNYQWGLVDDETKQKNDYNAHHIALCSNGTEIVGIYNPTQNDVGDSICIVTIHADATNTTIIMWKSNYDFNKAHNLAVDSEFEPCLKTLQRIADRWSSNSSKTKFSKW